MLTRYAPVVLISFLSCVDPFSTETKKESDRYIIEGTFSNQAPPYSLKITKSANYSQNLDGITRYVSGATVQAFDAEGNCTPYFEVETGRYQTAVGATPGEIGKSYHLEITTPDGSRIFSHPEQMIDSPPITSVYAEFDPSTIIDEGFSVYLDVKDPADEKNYYKWETIGYYPYSQYCFTLEGERSIFAIESDKTVDGNILSRVPIKHIAFNSTTNYVLQVYQLALSAGAYEFLDGIKKQVQSTGSIFDPPPSFLRGNLYNPDDDLDIVLGYFIVAGASRKDLVLDRSTTGQFPHPYIGTIDEPLYCGDPCNQLCVGFGGGTCGNRPCPPDCANLPGKTNIAPDAWPLTHHPCGD
ncbi:MAG TPA: DUF4249 domain-containing protein [Chryseolinea sp.]|nr:DUF4249 domain-containing protein [Chryseolinea sp.]